MINRAIDEFAMGIILGVLTGILGNLWVSYWLVLYPPSPELAPWLLVGATVILVFASFMITKQRRIEIGKLLKQGEILESLLGAMVRTKDDKRGKIVKNDDGSYAVHWTLNLSEKLSICDTVDKKKEEV